MQKLDQVHCNLPDNAERSGFIVGAGGKGPGSLLGSNCTCHLASPGRALDHTADWAGVPCLPASLGRWGLNLLAAQRTSLCRTAKYLEIVEVSGRLDNAMILMRWPSPPPHLVQAEPLLHTLGMKRMATRQQARLLLCLKVELADRAPAGMLWRDDPSLLCKFQTYLPAASGVDGHTKWNMPCASPTPPCAAVLTWCPGLHFAGLPPWPMSFWAGPPRPPHSGPC